MKVSTEADKVSRCYTWVNKNTRVARIPIEHAMELTVTDLAKQKPAPPGPIAPPEPQETAAAGTSPAPASPPAPAGSPQLGGASPVVSPAAQAPASPSPAAQSSSPSPASPSPTKSP